MTKFDFETIENFDEHINLSIPDYSSMVEQVVNFSSFFIKPNSAYYDIGCSTGSLLTKINLKNINTGFRAIGIDKSRHLTDCHPDTFICDFETDLDGFEFDENTTFITVIFTLQFLSYETKVKLLEKIHDSLKVGGGVIICEKIFLNDGFFQDLFTFTHYDYKLKSFSEKEIMQKQFDLRYIMRPVSERENLQLFSDAGFHKVESFWQSLNFKGWVLIK